MKKYFIVGLLIILSVSTGWIARSYFGDDREIINPVANIISKPLEKYSIENLSEANIVPGVLQIGEMLSEEDEFTSFLFEFSFDPTIDDGKSKTTTGQINIPLEGDSLPVVVMFRGYVDQQLYTTGTGTNRAAEVFAESGFITIAPDFLGYAGSSTEAGNIFEARFQTYTTALTLLASLDQIEKWDKRNIFIWGHSNGGQIALTVLEVTQNSYPATLWAPVSKPFPYSILYYTDEAEDRGKLIRRELAEFEELYDVEEYSLVNYLDKIEAPIQIHQGNSDDSVPAAWSDELASWLEKGGKDLKYYKYPGADHNLRPSWNSVVERDLSFFQSHLSQ